MSEWKNCGDLNFLGYGGNLIRQNDKYPDNYEVLRVWTSADMEMLDDDNFYIEHFDVDLNAVPDWKEVAYISGLEDLPEEKFLSLPPELRIGDAITCYGGFVFDSFDYEDADHPKGEFTFDQFLNFCDDMGVKRDILGISEPSLDAECKDMSQAKENVNESHEDMGKEKEGR